MGLLDVAAAVMVILPVGDWLAAVVLTSAARHDGIALRERARVASVLALAATACAVLAAGRLLGVTLPRELSIPLLITALVLISVPSYGWLWLYWRGAFDGR